MTPTQKVIALAELEGFEKAIDYDNPASSYYQCWRQRDGGYSRHLPDYLTSHDALQPLLEKMTEEEWTSFDDALVPLIAGRRFFPYYAGFYLTITPEQKADCILKACGKWKEQGG